MSPLNLVAAIKACCCVGSAGTVLNASIIVVQQIAVQCTVAELERVKER
jgi:hypothetical protein